MVSIGLRAFAARRSAVFAGWLPGLVLAAAGALAAGCSARSGATTSAARVSNPTPTPAPTPAPTPEPPPPPRPVAAPGGDVCVPTWDGACLPGPVFHERAEELAGAYIGEVNFEAQWGYPLLNLHRAYAHVNLLEGPDTPPGAGVTIGFIDTGLDEDHPVFAGKWIHEDLLFGAEPETGEDDSHGTAVASVAAGLPTGVPEMPQGVAWGSDIAMFAIPLGTGDGVYTPIPLEDLGLADPGMADLFRGVLAWRGEDRKIDVLNLSFGYEGIIDGYSQADLREYFSQTLEVLSQPGVADPTILVWAAGNANGDRCGATTPNCENGRFDAVSVSILPGLAARIEELQGHSVAVVALGPEGGAIADFSNRCGLAAAICIAAPGEQVRAAWFGPDDEGAPARGSAAFSGTSLAAPMVSGGLALMKQVFRGQLSNTELVSRLFLTADDTGIYADRSIYGHGRMDLGAATSPVGVLDVPLAAYPAAAASVALDSTRLQMGTAFGDGLSAALREREIMALDDFGAPFWYSLGSFAVSTDGPSLAHRLRTFLAPAAAASFGDTSGGRVRAAAGATGHLALAEGALVAPAAWREELDFAVFTTGLGRPLRPAAGGALRWQLPGLPAEFVAGWIREPESLLGSLAQGAFGQFSASTAFTGLDAGASLGRWSFGARGEVGVVRADSRGGILEDLSPLVTSTFELNAATGFGDGSRLRLSLSQPLRVDRGWASLTVPSARMPGGEVVHRPLRADLSPSGRQLDVAAGWHRPLAGGELRLGALWSRWPAHQDLPLSGLALLSGWRWTF